MGQEFKKGDKVRALKDYKSIFTGRGFFVKGEIYEVAYVSGNYLEVVEDSVGKGNVWGKEHFELVETAPTLKDLREKALEAFDEGYLDRVYFKKTRRERIVTFTIETVKDLKRIKQGALGVLSNGEEFEVTSEYVCMFGEEDSVAITVNFGGLDHNELMYLTPLKGAIITQRKAIKENK